MSRYGIDYYGLSTYGDATSVSYVAGSFTAQARSYNSIRLKWASPSGAWSDIRLVRNSYGFPVNAYDGDVLVNVAKENDPTIYNDTYNLSKGSFYYYSIFVYETFNYKWVRAGNVMGVSVKNYNYGKNLYDYLPGIYKIKQAYIATADWDNDDLYRFMSLFGFQLDYVQTVTELLVERYNLEKVGGMLIPSLLQQFGLTYEPEIGYQQSRILIRDAVTIGKKKGSADGLREYMKAFTGYAVPQPVAGTPNSSLDGLVKSHNLMLDYNDSSFEESKGHWASSDATSTISNVIVESVTAVSITSNVARAIIGAHNYTVGNKINLSNFSLSLFNTGGTPKTITAIDATSVYYALTAPDLAQTSAYNAATASYGVLTPYPAPWAETTAPALYPNKQKGILAVKNSTGSSATIKLECGYTNPLIKGIPVTAGLNYVFSVYSAAGSTIRGIVLKTRWYSRLGDFISESTGSSLNNTVGDFSARPVVSGTAPTDAYYAVPVITIVSAGASASNEYHYFDCAQFEQAATVTSFDEARQLHLTLKATRINELLNPHFASPITPWSVTGATTAVSATNHEPEAQIYNITHRSITSNVATLETDVSHNFKPGDSISITGAGTIFNGVKMITSVRVNPANPTQISKSFTYALTNADVARVASTGTVHLSGNSLKLTASATSVLLKSTTTTADLMGIYYPSTSYTFSVYTQVTTGSEVVTPSIHWYDLSKNPISTSTGNPFTITATGTSWNRPFVTATAPATAAYAHVALSWTAAIGDIIFIDSALFENSSALSPYFDGSGGPGETSDLFWEGGVVNGSRSHLYKNRFAVQTRLSGAALSSQVNLGTTVAVYVAQPKT
jgi:hypothetical protein